MADAARGKARPSYAWGRWSALGLTVAVAACIFDQATKFWLLDVFDLGNRGRVTVMPFVDFILTWNKGISYGLFPQEGAGQWALFAFKILAVVFLWAWLARVSSRRTAVALGLIIGGALGNALDRLHWPGVLDFVLLHAETPSWSFVWYVFNVADVAIVAGVLGLLYESMRNRDAVKAP